MALKKTVNLEKVPLVLEDATGDVLAKASFTPKELKVRANTSKPWVFIFPQSMLKKRNLIHLINGKYTCHKNNCLIRLVKSFISLFKNIKGGS
ncbi:SLAP domain-containing protein [Geomicrobium sp. JCM 19055]|uniref:SLAP domain-containing protein n=1 Tax=Geomicrobium sp. JCM 19055 TaxID=1460649 RepID=UPI000694514E